MKSYQFNKKEPIDVLELLINDLRKLIENKNLPLTENSENDREDYIDFINQERQSTIDINELITGELYSPLSLIGATANAAMAIRTTIKDVEFCQLTESKIVFLNEDGQTATFPPNNLERGDTTVDTLIFKTQGDKNQFLSTLRLKFYGWQFHMNYL